MFKGVLPYLIALLSLAVSCSEPTFYEDFRAAQDRDSLGRFSFECSLSDSLAVYDMSFYTRIDCSQKVFRNIDDIRVDVTLISPSGSSYVETVYIRNSDFHTIMRGTYDCRVPYRSGVVPVEYGGWKVFLTLPEVVGLRGMGLIIQKKNG